MTEMRFFKKTEQNARIALLQRLSEMWPEKVIGQVGARLSFAKRTRSTSCKFGYLKYFL